MSPGRNIQIAPIMSVEDVAAYLKLSTSKIYRMAERKEIPAVKIGGQWRFLKEKIDSWLEMLQLSPEESAFYHWVWGEARRSGSDKLSLSKINEIVHRVRKKG